MGIPAGEETGCAFKDEFKQLILADPEQLAICVTEKLISHFTDVPDLSLPCQKAKPSANSPTVTDLSNRA